MYFYPKRFRKILDKLIYIWLLKSISMPKVQDVFFFDPKFLQIHLMPAQGNIFSTSLVGTIGFRTATYAITARERRRTEESHGIMEVPYTMFVCFFGGCVVQFYGGWLGLGLVS